MRILRYLTLFALVLQGQDVTLPLKANSVRFAAIGDMGTGQAAQYQVAQRMLLFHQKFPFNFVITLGDNIYGGGSPTELERKFEIPYKPLLDVGVQFYAALGNHDDTNQRFYKFFNMNGQQYYTFKKENVRFFALDSNYMDPKQLIWLEKELANAGSEWKICFFHHPLYSSGEKHGPSLELRKVLEPLLMKNGVDVVFAGHEHFYERIKPQNGIQYFILGNSAKLRKGGIATSEITAKGFDTDNAFMIAEITGDEMSFQTISRKGTVIDSGKFRRAERKAATND